MWVTSLLPVDVVAGEPNADEKRKALLAKTSDEGISDAERILAIRDAIPLVKDAQDVHALLDLASAKDNPNFLSGLIEELSASSSDGVATELLARWKKLPASARRSAITTMLRRLTWTNSLLDAIENDAGLANEFTIEQVQFLLNHPQAALAERAKRLFKAAGRLPESDRKKVLTDFLPAANAKGDAKNGKGIFQNHCAKCHRLNDSGTNAGPDLIGISLREKTAILSDILDPNCELDNRFKQNILRTADGRIYTGMLMNGLSTVVELRDLQRQRIFPKAEIAELTHTGRSFMPEGFEYLGPDNLRDLLEFLVEKGAFVVVPIGKVATIASNQRMFDGKSNDEKIVLQRWGPQVVEGVPFSMPEPQRDERNAILLFGPKGAVCSKMPKSVTVPCHCDTKMIHLLATSGWGFPATPADTVSVIVRLRYEDGDIEEQNLLNGVHLADYSNDADVPKSKPALKVRNHQIRMISIQPKRPAAMIKEIEFAKGPDDSSPVIFAITLERAVPEK